MIISHKELQSQITGAIAWDAHRQNGGQVEQSLWQMFAFDDHGVHYLSAECRRFMKLIDACDQRLSCLCREIGIDEVERMALERNDIVLH